MRPLFAATLGMLFASFAVAILPNRVLVLLLMMVGVLLLAAIPPAGSYKRVAIVIGAILGVMAVGLHPLANAGIPNTLPTEIIGDVCSPIRRGQTSLRFIVCTSTGKYAIRTSTEQPLSYLDRVRVTSDFSVPEPPRNIGEFNYQQWCRFHHIVAVSAAASNVVLLEKRTNIVGRFISYVRTWIDTRCHSGLPADTAPLASGILLSITDDLPFELQESFGRTGTVHVLSTSGMHISVLVATVGTILIWSGRTGSAGVSLGLSILVGYASGGGPAPLRAVTSLVARLMARLLSRSPEPWHLLCLCACAAMLRDPFVVMDAGAQLSFLAVCGLIVAAPFADLFGERIRQSPSVVLKVAFTLLQGFIVSFIVTLVTAPAVAFHMQHLSLISPVANIPVGFLSEWALLIGAAAVTIGDIPIVGKLIWTLLNGVLQSLIFVANILADVPYADVATGVANPYAVVVASVGLVSGFAQLGRKLCGSAFASQPQYYIPWSPSKPLT